MDKIFLINRLAKTNSGDVAHTSAYARAQNGDNIGAGSTQSFQARQSIEDGRQYVRSYRDSQLGSNPYNRRVVKGSSTLNGAKVSDANNASSQQPIDNFNSNRAPSRTSGKHSAGPLGGSSSHHSRDAIGASSSFGKKITKASPVNQQRALPSRPAMPSIRPNSRPKF